MGKRNGPALFSTDDSAPAALLISRGDIHHEGHSLLRPAGLGNDLLTINPPRNPTMSNPASLPLNGYGITYVTLDDNGLSFESELAIHLEDGGLLALPMQTRQSERLAIHDQLCVRNGWCQAA